jgi:hypothetical protein
MATRYPIALLGFQMPFRDLPHYNHNWELSTIYRNLCPYPHSITLSGNPHLCHIPFLIPLPKPIINSSRAVRVTLHTF